MKLFRNIAFAALAGFVGFTLLPSLQADDWNKKTILTITEPLEVPSCCTPDHTVILQPGEYVMVLVDSLSDRHIVRIFDKDQKHVMTTILAIPNYRLRATGKTVFGFWEVPAGQPAALRAWFYPGDNFGQEFAYPKQKAAEIAAFVKVPVPAIVAETAAEEDLRTAPIAVVQESGQTEPVVVAAAVTPAPEVAAVAPAETPAPVETLPQTASNMPLVGLAGLASLAMFAALGFSSRRRRSSKA
jgi:LPXTG-motif cell wall-anchored protein